MTVPRGCPIALPRATWRRQRRNPCVGNPGIGAAAAAAASGGATGGDTIPGFIVGPTLGILGIAHLNTAEFIKPL